MTKTDFKLKWPDKSQVSLGAFATVKKLRSKGSEAYIAGGAVRDALLKRPIKEIDIATSATPAQVKKMFVKTIPTGEKHGTITVRLNKINYEVTTFRIEGPYEKSRRPSKVKFITDSRLDAERRDFTINAMFYDSERARVIDYINGIADISHKKIRFVGDPAARVREDALRLLRAVRFATVLDFGLARETRLTVRKNAKLIRNISAERIKQELDRIMISDNLSIGIGLLDIVGLLEYILPEIKAMQGVSQPRNQHAEGDVYTHSLLAIEETDHTYDLPTKYAVLFHDLGKPQTRQIRQGKATFYDHPNVGAEIAVKICKRLKFSSADTEKIRWLVKNHMVPNDFKLMRVGTRRKWGLNKYFPELLKVYLADARASLHPDGKSERSPEGYREGLKIFKEIQSRPELAKPLISGTEVMRILAIKEGPLVGKILRYVDEQKLAGKISTREAAAKLIKSKAAELKHL